MKKSFFVKNLIAFSLFLLFGVSISLICGCGKVELNNYSHEYISEYRKNLFATKTNFFTAIFTSGEREKNYNMDGAKTTLVDFGVLTVKFNSQIDDLTPQFELSINKDVFSGELEQNPYDGSFVFDIEKQIDDEDEVYLYLVDLDQRVKLVCVSNLWETTWEDAVEIFNNKFSKQISDHTTKGQLNGEVYIKIVSMDKNLDNIYWYVLCVCSNGDMYSCLIDPNTKEILQM